MKYIVKLMNDYKNNVDSVYGKVRRTFSLGRRFTYIFSVGYFDKFRKLDFRIEENKERLIDGLVKAIIVYDDHFEVFLTFDDSPITIPTSEEIESMKNSSDIASVTSPTRKRRTTVRLFPFGDPFRRNEPFQLPHCLFGISLC